MDLFDMLVTGGGNLKTVTFNESGTWVAPQGVFNVSMVGEGVDGIPSYIADASRNVVIVNYRTDTSTGTGNANWSSVTNIVTSTVNQLRNTSTSSFDSYVFDVWPNGTNSFTTTDNFLGDFIKDSVVAYYSSDWKMSGAIQNSAFAGINYKSVVPAAAGANATAIGRTFPGGAAGQPAQPTIFSSTAVTPMQAYPIVVPSGGFVTISYYE